MHTGELISNLFPVPTRYVLVPCNVNGPGLRPSTLHTRSDSCSTAGRDSRTGLTRLAMSH